jgi:hypothetical protein
MVQAAVRIDVHPALEEPAKSGGVLEVELVEDHALEARHEEQVELLGAGALAGVVERVLVLGGTALDEQAGDVEVAPLDCAEQSGHPALAAPLDGVAVRIGSGVKEQLGATAHPRRGADRPPHQHEQRRDTADRRGRDAGFGLQASGERADVGQHERALHPVEGRGLHVMDQLWPALEAVLASDLKLGAAQADRALAPACLGLLAQVLE